MSTTQPNKAAHGDSNIYNIQLENKSNKLTRFVWQNDEAIFDNPNVTRNYWNQ